MRIMVSKYNLKCKITAKKPKFIGMMQTNLIDLSTLNRELYYRMPQYRALSKLITTRDLMIRLKDKRRFMRIIMELWNREPI
jgi:hypothetical protein